MLGNVNVMYMHIAVIFLILRTCAAEPAAPYLALHSPGDAEYTDVLVRRARDNLTLLCAVRGDAAPRVYVWNFVGENGTDRTRLLTAEPPGVTASSRLEMTDLQPSDSGHYICSAPPFSSTKYVLVQPRGGRQCARTAFWCGARCVLPAYVCDGRRDCARAEDEAPPLCAPRPCARAGRLNCSSGRCIPEAACCRPGAPLCRQPACCDEHARYSPLEGYAELEYPPLFDDRRAPDDYGFIQSTIYTVTACALIFMIAVVLLVSALCKMHMKRAALRGYASAHRDTAHHYAARFPPRYEAARLLEGGAPASPARTLGVPELPSPETPSTAAGDAVEPPPYGGSFGLARLSAIFCSRYRQVPTQCCDVELRDMGLRDADLRDMELRELRLRDAGLGGSQEFGYMPTPVEFFRQRAARRNTIDRVMEQLSQSRRPLTLQLGRFHLSIPRLRRDEPRPDTPNVSELGPPAAAPRSPAHSRPPPYSEAVRHKCGPPPQYLSTERLDAASECRARANVEMPPCYEDLAPARVTVTAVDADAPAAPSAADAENGNDAPRGRGDVSDDAINDNELFACNETISSVIDNLPAIDSDVNANDPAYGAVA